MSQPSTSKGTTHATRSVCAGLRPTHIRLGKVWVKGVLRRHQFETLHYLLAVRLVVDHQNIQTMDAYVQLIRNFLCCIKDLGWFSNTWLYDANMASYYHGLPHPLNKTTPLEILISICQFFVVVKGVPSSWSLFWTSAGKVNRIYRLLDDSSDLPPSKSPHAATIIQRSLFKESIMGVRSMYVGFNVLCISGAFLWLTANSWHVTETDWMGGLPALIHALTVMNICLAPLLYFMIKDAYEQFRKARVIREAVRKGGANAWNLPALEAATKWIPFWDKGIDVMADVDLAEERKLWEKEITTVEQHLKKPVSDFEDTLTAKVGVHRIEGFREFGYFVLNLIAWYGYSICVLMYYFPEAKRPDWLQVITGYANADAAYLDWSGNFAGDLMWTFEPVVILLSPFYLSSVFLSTKRAVRARKKRQ